METTIKVTEYNIADAPALVSIAIIVVIAIVATVIIIHRKKHKK